MDEDIIVEVPGVGRVAFPSSMSQEEISAAAEKLYSQSQTNQEQTSILAPLRPEFTKPEFWQGPVGTTLGRAARSAIQGFSAPASMVLDPFYQLAGMEPASKQQAQALTTLGVPTYPQNMLGRIAEQTTESVSGLGSQLGIFQRLAERATSPVTRQVSTQLAAQPVAQTAAAAAAPAGSELTYAATENPVLSYVGGVVASVGAGQATPRKFKRPEGPTPQEAQTNYQNLYNRAKNAGVVIDTKGFQQQMFDITRNLREEGYTPTGFPGIKGAIDELTSLDMPKDIVELKALRNIIKAAGSESDEARRLSQILLGRFDDYIVNVPENQIAAGDKKGLAYWKQARDAYTKEMKAEVFDDMLERADIKGSARFTQSGVENALARELDNLATNKKKLRFFTKAEQEQIKSFAKGGKVQNFLRWAGKLSPTSVIAQSAGIYIGGSLLGPVGAAALPVVGFGARKAAESKRVGDVQMLAEMMRTGQMPTTPSVVPQTLMRGLLSSEYPME